MLWSSRKGGGKKGETNHTKKFVWFRKPYKKICMVSQTIQKNLYGLNNDKLHPFKWV
jgi:hypothetical protein